MQLTKEQIQQIENYLDFKGLKHIDVRLEVLDHMISDIEISMQKNHLNFSQAFKKTIVQWKDQLKSDSSWYLGAAYSAPSVVIKKVEQSYKKWFLPTLLLSFIPTLLISKIGFIENSFHIFKWVGTSLILILSIPIFLWYFNMKKHKLNTTHLFLFEKQVFYAYIFMLLFSFGNSFSDAHMGYYFLPVAILIMFLGKNLYQKHLKIVKRHQLN